MQSLSSSFVGTLRVGFTSSPRTHRHDDRPRRRERPLSCAVAATAVPTGEGRDGWLPRRRSAPLEPQPRQADDGRREGVLCKATSLRGGEAERARSPNRELSGEVAVGQTTVRTGGVFKDAAVKVLRVERRLMSAAEITRRAFELGHLGQTKGKTPEATMAARLYSDTRGRAGGGASESVFCRPAEGVFGLSEWRDDPELARLLTDSPTPLRGKQPPSVTPAATVVKRRALPARVLPPPPAKSSGATAPRPAAAAAATATASAASSTTKERTGSPSSSSSAAGKKSSSSGAPRLQPASPEQAVIVKDSVAGDNICVSAVAGSGKTTTILHIAIARPTHQFIAILYNRAMVDDFKKALAMAGVDNVEAFTFHGFCLGFYGERSDTGITAVLAADRRPQRRLAYDTLILDEKQDVTPVLYRLACKAMRDNAKGPPQLIVLGDERQMVYGFRDADSRFLSEAPLIFGNVAADRPWRKRTISETFRLTGNMGWVLNHCLLPAPFLTTVKPDGYPVVYVAGDPYQTAMRTAEFIDDLISGGKYRAEEVMVLAPSIKGGERSTPLNKLETALAQRSHKVFVPVDDESSLPDEEVLKDKIIFLTYHRAKGLERKAVFVLQCDLSYFVFNARDARRDMCTNAQYVAWTRASDLLVLVGEEQGFASRLPFVRRLNEAEQSKKLHRITLAPKLSSSGAVKTKDNDSRNISVTDLTKHVPESLMVQLMDMVAVETVQEAQFADPYPFDAESGSGVEYIRDVVGVAVPAIYAHRTTGRFDLPVIARRALFNRRASAVSTGKAAPGWKLDSSKQKEETAETKLADENEQWVTMTDDQFLKTALQNVKPTDIANHLNVACIYLYATSGYISRAKEMRQKGKWDGIVTEEMLELSCTVLRQQLGGAGTVQYEAEAEGVHPLCASGASFPKVTIKGRADAIAQLSSTASSSSGFTIFEFKLTGDPDPAHYLQLLTYVWLYGFHREGSKTKPDGTTQAVLLPPAVAALGEIPGGRVLRAPPQGRPSWPVVEARFASLGTGLVQRVTISAEELDAVVRLLIENKLRTEHSCSDEQFLANCEQDSRAWWRTGIGKK